MTRNIRIPEIARLYCQQANRTREEASNGGRVSQTMSLKLVDEKELYVQLAAIDSRIEP